MTTPLERAKDFLQSLKNFLLTGGDLVNQDIANQRAYICIACHNNVPGDQARPTVKRCCGGGVRVIEDAFIATAKASLLQGRATPNNSKLLSCAICGCDNKLAVWFPTVPLGMNEE